ncbi:4530_t:CDS:2, partial [Paraglomus occultum]
MVSSTLLSFISDTFAKLNNNHHPFGGINVVLIGDLAQLPPVNAPNVFYSPVWKIFHPLFLTKSQRQISDPIFFNLLQEIRTGNISDESWNILEQNHMNSLNEGNEDDNEDNGEDSADDADKVHAKLNTTHIVGYRQSADPLITSVKKLNRGEHDLQLIEAYTINLDDQYVNLSITAWLPKNITTTAHINTVNRNDIVDLDGTITEIKDNKLSITAYRLEINNYDHLNLPTNKSCILAAGIVDTKPQQQKNQIFFRISASQHKGDKTATNPFNQCSIFCTHDASQTHLLARTTKLLPRSKVWVTGDFGVDENQLYVQLDNMEY